MQQFFIVAVLYGFAMLLPASNHAKILRTAMGAGGHAAMAASFGIAIGTGVICAMAFVAAAMLGNRGLWTLAMQCTGCLLLLRLAGMCLRDAGLTTLSPLSPQMPWGLRARSRWPHAEAGCLLALASTSNWMLQFAVAALLTGLVADTGTKAAYVAGLSGVALSLGLLMAWLGSHLRWARRYCRLLPWLEHAAGLVTGAVSVAYLAGALGTTLVWASITGQARLPESMMAAPRSIPCALPHCRARRGGRPDRDL
ncbi:lysine transporter LysE [Stenotrophomonas maltophilia]|uniref:lysine transporter LysE n=1 Tax=Stenotrophomonas geniculata TaxID=86188 RepID=UPI0018D3FD61|nr:lysine transporter LysE [Stenotrophomonas maltophilia]